MCPDGLSPATPPLLSPQVRWEANGTEADYRTGADAKFDLAVEFASTPYIAEGAVVTYGDVRHTEDLQYSVYNFEEADVDRLWAHFNSYEAEAQALLAKANALMADEKATAAEKLRFPLMSTYELALKCSNLFNLLDARGAISVTERVGMIGRIRTLAVGVAKVYAAQQTV